MITIEKDRTDHIGYIRTKYNVPACLQIVVKQGYVTKDVAPEPAKPQRKREEQLHALTRSAIARMDAIVDETGAEITRLIKVWEAEPQLRALGADRLYEQIAAMVDKMYDDLAQSIKTHIQAIYQTAYTQASGQFALVSLYDEAPFVNVFASLQKAQTKMKSSIYEALNTPVDDEKTEKLLGGLLALGLLALGLAAALSGCENTKEKEKLAAEHAEALAKVEAEKDVLHAQGVAKYQIVLSNNDDACAKCQEMDGKIFALEDFDIGVTAPPFHPNCGCSIVEFVEEIEEPEWEEPIHLSDQCVEMMLSWEGPYYAKPTHVSVNGKKEPYPTIGYGHYMMGEVEAGKTTVTIEGVEYSELTQELAMRLFWQDVTERFAPKLDAFLEANELTLTQWQYDAVLMDMYQKGQNILNEGSKAALRQYLLDQDFTDYNACLEAFIGTTTIPGLIRRRTDEANLFFYGEYHNNA